jgi:hypothetical protein
LHNFPYRSPRVIFSLSQPNKQAGAVVEEVVTRDPSATVAITGNLLSKIIQSIGFIEAAGVLVLLYPENTAVDDIPIPISPADTFPRDVTREEEEKEDVCKRSGYIRMIMEPNICLGYTRNNQEGKGIRYEIDVTRELSGIPKLGPETKNLVIFVLLYNRGIGQRPGVEFDGALTESFTLFDSKCHNEYTSDPIRYPHIAKTHITSLERQLGVLSTTPFNLVWIFPSDNLKVSWETVLRDRYQGAFPPRFNIRVVKRGYC